MNLFTDLVSQINIFILEISKLTTGFAVNYPVKSVTIFIAFCVLIVLVTSTKRRYLSGERQKAGQIIPRLISPLSIYIIIYYFYHQYENSLILMLLNSVSLFWLLMSLIYLPYLYIKDISRLKISFVPPLIVLGICLNMISNLLEGSFNHLASETVLLLSIAAVSTKIVAVFAFYLYMRALLVPMLNMLSRIFPLIDKVRPLFRYSLFLLLLCGGLWIFNIIQFGINFFFGVALLLILSSMLYYLNINMLGWVERFFTTAYFERIEQLKITKRSRTLLSLMMLWVYYNIGFQLMNFQKITELLSTFYIIDSVLIKISIFKILTAVWLFTVLRSILFIISQYLRIASARENDTVTSSSIETLTFNVGTLIIFVVASVELGITWQIVVPVAGAIGIGIGVGIQGILNNYISGFILLFSKKVKIGDIVELEGNAGRLIGLETDTVFGKVKAIDIFATTIKTFDNVDVAVPNSVFISDNIVNYTQEDDVVRVRIPIGVSYLSDVEKVKSVIMEAVMESNYVLKHRANDVWFHEFGDSALNFYALCWVDIKQAKHPRNVRVDIIERVWYKFKENSIEIPYPQQDVWFRNDLNVEYSSKVSEKDKSVKE